MRKAGVVIIVGLLAALLVAIHVGVGYKKEIARLSENERTLLTDVECFRVSDSLNAAKVGMLTLSLDQYKRYRAEDARLISELGVKYRDLQSVNAAQTETIRRLRGSVRDSVINIDRITPDTVKCAKIADKWLDLEVCFLPDGTYTGEYRSRDSLIIVTETKYKRFLGFLWHTNKVKSRNVEVVSRNPNTKITGFEFIELNK